MCARARLFVFSGAWIRACCLVSSGRIVKPGGSRNLASEPIHADSRSRRRWAIGTSTARRSTQTRCTSVAPSRPHTRARRIVHARACTHPCAPAGARTLTQGLSHARIIRTHTHARARSKPRVGALTRTHARTHTQARTRSCKRTNPHTRTPIHAGRPTHAHNTRAGRAIAASGIPREDLILAGKVPSHTNTRARARAPGGHT